MAKTRKRSSTVSKLADKARSGMRKVARLVKGKPRRRTVKTPVTPIMHDHD
jgi:hypothetical protein